MKPPRASSPIISSASGLPVPGRGFVTIYTDITKRAQAEIATNVLHNVRRCGPTPPRACRATLGP